VQLDLELLLCIDPKPLHVLPRELVGNLLLLRPQGLLEVEGIILDATIADLKGLPEFGVDVRLLRKTLLEFGHNFVMILHVQNICHLFLLEVPLLRHLHLLVLILQVHWLG